MAEDDQAFLAAASEIVAVLDEVPYRTLLLDDRGIIRWQNKASVALRGLRKGRHFTAAVSPADRADAEAAFAAVRRGEASVDVLVRTLDVSNKRYVRVLGRWKAVELRDGTKIVLVVNLGDVPATDASAGTVTAGLTPRQLEVLRLLDAGRSTVEIAQELSLSTTTVRNHIANLLPVLGAHARLQAIAVARACGILTP